MSTIHTLPAYTLLPTEVDSPAAMVAALKAAHILDMEDYLADQPSRQEDEAYQREVQAAQANCQHEWKDDHNGTVCRKCKLFYPDGCAPWDLPIPAPRPRQPKPRQTLRFVERYFRSTVNGDVSIITLTQLRQRSQGKPNTLLYWAESCWIGDKYDSRFVDVVRISPDEATR